MTNSSRRARRSSATSSSRPTRSSAIVGAYITYCALPDAFARYIATSAARRRSSATVPSAIPTLALTKTSRPSSSNGVCSAATIRSAASTADRGAGDLLDQHGELVPSQPRDREAGRERIAEPHADAAQERVAGGVPERVVDALEVVEVEEEHCDLRTRLLAAEDERVLDAVREQRAVREPRQRVVERLVAELLLGLPSRGDVEQVALEHRARSPSRHDAGLVLHPQVATVARAQSVLDEQRLARRVRPLMSSENALSVLRMQELDEEIVVLRPTRRRCSRASARSAGSCRGSS